MKRIAEDDSSATQPTAAIKHTRRDREASEDPQQSSAISKQAAGAMHTRLGSRLNGRLVTRNRARGGDGFGSDTDALSTVHQQQTADPSHAAKGDLSRKPAPLVPGQASPLLPAYTGARIGIPSAPGTLPPAPLPCPAAASSKSSSTRHRRSHSAGQLQVQLSLTDDLESMADASPKAAPSQQQLQEDDCPATKPAKAGSLQRRSARLAAFETAAKQHGNIKLTNGSNSSRTVGRASAPARQLRRTGSSTAAAASAASHAHAAAGLKAVLPHHPVAAPAASGASSDPVPSPAASEQLDINTPSSAASKARRVSFAPGPLDPSQHPHSTDDGHPALEGAVAVPVRRVPVTYGFDLSRGNVLMLEQLLGAECIMSVTRLKRRVGLLPPIRPPRPHATSNTRGAAAAAAGNGGIVPNDGHMGQQQL